MTETSESTFSEEIEFTTEHRVSCNGGGGNLGHPIVYLEMGEDDEVTCGYCDKRFILKGGKADPNRV